MTITAHVSPDDGLPVLREFLAGTRRRLTVGMYDFTSAEILRGVLEVARYFEGIFLQDWVRCESDRSPEIRTPSHAA